MSGRLWYKCISYTVIVRECSCITEKQKHFEPHHWVSQCPRLQQSYTFNATGGNNIPLFFFVDTELSVGWSGNLIYQINKKSRKKRNETRKSEVGKNPTVTWWFGYGKVNWTANKHKKHQFHVHTQAHTHSLAPNHTLIHTDSPYKENCNNSSHDNVHMCLVCNVMYSRRLSTIIAYYYCFCYYSEWVEEVEVEEEEK